MILIDTVFWVCGGAASVAKPFEESEIRFLNVDEWTQRYIHENAKENDFVIENSNSRRARFLGHWKDFRVDCDS